MKIAFFLQYDDLGSSSKYRILLYKDKFDEKYDTKYCCFWSNNYIKKYMLNKRKYVLHIGISYIWNLIKRILQILFIIPKYDVLVIQRCIIPFFKPTLLKYLKKHQVRIVFDIDDALHTDKKYNCIKIAKHADCVIVGSGELQKYYSTICGNVKFIPTVDNDLTYKPYRVDTFENKCIGWIGSFSTIENLSIIVNAVNRIIKEYPDVYVKIISDSSLGYDKKIKNCKFVEWSSDSYLQEMKEFTIGIMPLIDNEFNRGKCGFKLIQYLDLGKPVLASDCGENATIVGDYGKICRDEDEWYKYLKQMLFESAFYRSCTDNIKRDFLKRYGYESTFARLEEYICR